MNVYEESLLNVLMPDGAPGPWLENEDFSPYIQHLASCGLQKLSSECDALKDEQAALLEQTRELAYKEYLTFIHASDCSKSLHSQLGSLEQQLGNTSLSVSSLHSTLDRFVSTSRSLLVSRQLNSTTLAKHTQLLEILELSQLLDTCVRNGYHDEALEIIAYVRRLEKRHGGIPVIKSIVREVQASSQQMLSQLLAQLRSDVSLPQCLKVVGLIRTLDVFTECQLRLKFLHARDAWMAAALVAVPSHDPHQHISKTVECARVHLFDIVTQYRAIFSDEEPHYTALHLADLPALLQSWLLHRVSGLLADVRRSLLASSVSGSSLESLMAQCLFFGQSLSRIGADFRGLLTDMFVEAGGRQLERDIRAANHKFDETLSCYNLMDAVPAAAPAASLLDSGISPPSSGGRPPLGLLEFPPLAHYLNSLVSALNTLRLCCFTALLPTLLSLLTESLNKVVRSLVELHEVECSGFSGAEAAAFGRLCSAVKTVLLPHLNTSCLRALYPLNHLAAVTGSSGLQLAKMNFGQLDAEAICLPLKPFLRQTVPEADADDHVAAAGADGSDLDALLCAGVTESRDSLVPASAEDVSEMGAVSGSSRSPESIAKHVSVGSHVNPDAGVAYLVDATAHFSADVKKAETDPVESLPAVRSEGTASYTEASSGNTDFSLPESLRLGPSESAVVLGYPGSFEGVSPSEPLKDSTPVCRQVAIETDSLAGALTGVPIASSPVSIGDNRNAVPATLRDDLAEVPLDD